MLLMEEAERISREEHGSRNFWCRNKKLLCKNGIHFRRAVYVQVTGVAKRRREKKTESENCYALSIFISDVNFIQYTNLLKNN